MSWTANAPVDTMAPVRLTKRIEFAASHRYARPEWDEARNRAAFGACYNEPGHGHNYLLEVTVAGEVDPHTGMVVNLFNLKYVLLHILEEFDHKQLNLDTPYFQDQVPTTENIARVLWEKLVDQPDIGALDTIRLYEDEDLFAEISGATGLTVAGVTRRYSFTAVHEEESRQGSNTWQGHTWDVFVTVKGPIHEKTGMVTDLRALDQVVQHDVLDALDGRDLRAVLQKRTVSGAHVVKVIWDRLVEKIPGGTLHRLCLVQTRDQAFEYSG